MRVVIDTKNFALYNGGIAHWFAPLLASWIAKRRDVHFLLLGPDFDMGFLPRLENWEHVPLRWPAHLPRPLRHPWYDNVIFPRAVARLRPDRVMSPYHDVRMPGGVRSAITVHDLCLDELDTVYPRRVRLYYLHLLRRNLRLASHVLTVSETSKGKLEQRYRVPAGRVRVVYNASPQGFADAPRAAELAGFSQRHGLHGDMLLYPGGSEFRKNVGRLAQAFAVLAQRHPALQLLVTGNADARWNNALSGLAEPVRQRVRFAGHLSDSDLALAYASASAVVYPSLCEGFGRVCLEAMDSGAPLACSDIPVMREVADDYAHYFDPCSVPAMVQAVTDALAQNRASPRREPRFQTEAVEISFLQAMDDFLQD